ncbi:MAG: phosphate ABC transporter permease subunit PstC [Candidatus Kapaibacterium sp.]
MLEPAVDQSTLSLAQKLSFHKPVSGRGVFFTILAGCAWFLVLLLSGVFITLVFKSLLSIKAFGFGFITNSTWNPVTGIFGGFPYIVGTVVTSVLALLLSFPFGMSIAILLGEYFRSGFISSILKNLLELLAGIPSVIYGFTALYFIVPLVRQFELSQNIQPAFGVSIIAATIVLSIMIIPYSASVAREIIQLVPSNLKEAAYAMGATRFEVVRKVILPYARSGIAAGFLLSFGRAVGETMAVTMVIGNANTLAKSLFDPSNTMASVIANEFTEATTEIYLSSLVEIALMLFVLTVIFDLIGRYIIKKMRTQK